MTVKELRELLKHCDDDMEVIFEVNRQGVKLQPIIDVVDDKDDEYVVLI